MKTTSKLQILASLFAALALIGLAPAQDDGSNDSEMGRQVIRVVGVGQAHGEPDVATLELGVTSFDRDARTAISFVDERIEAILAALTAQGVPEEAVRTVGYNIWREERYEGEGREPVPGFRAQHLLSIEVDGASRAGTILAAAVDAGANQVGGIEFGFSDRSSLEALARERAVTDALERARQLAAAAGAQVGRVLVIEEFASGGGPMPAAAFDRSAAVMSAAPIATGQLTVEVRVGVTVELRAGGQ